MSYQATQDSDNTKLKETEIGMVPEEWDVVKVGEVGKIITGTTPSTKDRTYYGSSHMFISPADIGDAKYVRISGKHLSDKGLKKSRPLPKDSVLVVCIGATIGKTAMTLVENCTTNQQINAIVQDDSVLPDFLYYVVSFRSQSLPSLAGGIGIPIINKSNFENFLVLRPPLPEQKAIAHILSTVQRAKEATEQVIQATKELKKSLMKHLFTYGAVSLEEAPNVKLKETEIGMVPEEWEVKELKELTHKITDGAHRTPTYVEDGIPFLRVTDIQRPHIDWSKTKYIPESEHAELIKRCNPEKGDILLSKNGTIGLTKVIDWDREVSLFVSLCLIKPIKDIIENHYLSDYLSSNGLPQILERGKKMTVTNLHLVEIKQLLIPVPTFKIQSKISEIISKVDSSIQSEENRLKALDQLFKTLLNNLMTGKIRVKNFEVPQA